MTELKKKFGKKSGAGSGGITRKEDRIRTHKVFLVVSMAFYKKIL